MSTSTGTYNIAYRLQNTHVLGTHHPTEPVYIYLATAIDIAQAMLAHETSKQALVTLALQYDDSVLQSFHFHRSQQRARQWIDWYIRQLINTFPLVLVDYTLEHPDCLGYHQRRQWNGTLQQFPFHTMGVHLNAYRVQSMVTASGISTEAGRRRFKTFLFAFAATLVHEAGPHTLITWLNNGRQDTPLGIGVSGYNNYHEGIGESGRWFELAVFGGTMEYYRDLNDDDGQVGLPHKIEPSGWAAPISTAFIDQICRHQIVYPFPCSEIRVDPAGRERMGKHWQGPCPNARTLMAAQLDLSHLRSFEIPRATLRQVPDNPHMMLTVTS